MKKNNQDPIYTALGITGPTDFSYQTLNKETLDKYKQNIEEETWSKWYWNNDIITCQETQLPYYFEDPYMPPFTSISYEAYTANDAISYIKTNTSQEGTIVKAQSILKQIDDLIEESSKCSNNDNFEGIGEFPKLPKAGIVALKKIISSIAIKCASTQEELNHIKNYGTNIKTDVFEMTEYCWCDKSGCKKCDLCECDTNSPTKTFRQRHNQSHCTQCNKPLVPTCNFSYHGIDMWWYKRIDYDSILVNTAKVDQKFWDIMETRCIQSVEEYLSQKKQNKTDNNNKYSRINTLEHL